MSRSLSTNPFAEDDDVQEVRFSASALHYQPVVSGRGIIGGPPGIPGGGPASTASNQTTKAKFQQQMAKADRRMKKRGVGSDIVAVDPADDNAVIRFLLNERGILRSKPY
jgi:hypothetical protein